MSTTPRTDSALLSSDCACNCGHTFKLISEEKYDQGKCVYTGPDIANGNDGVVVLADFARTLETELAAAKAEAAHYMSVAQKATDDLARLRADNLTAHQMACAAGLERDRLRADLERFTGHGLLDCHAICDQRDAAVAERDRLRAELADEKNLHTQTRTVVEELNTICTDLRNAGGPPFIRSEAIRLLREDQVTLRAEVERLKKQIKDDNRSYGCELRDPNGTIWEQAAKDRARAERAEAERDALRAAMKP